MTTEKMLGGYTRKEWLLFLGIPDADADTVSELSGLSFTGNALKVLRVNATADGWEFAGTTGTGNAVFSAGPTFTGTASFETGTFSGNMLATTDAASLGYTSGAGGAVTQATSRTTAVTLNKPCGRITLVSAAGTTTWQTMTVNSNKVANTDTIVVHQRSGTDKYMIHVTRVAAGVFDITYATTGGTTTEQPTFNFAIYRSINA